MPIAREPSYAPMVFASNSTVRPWSSSNSTIKLRAPEYFMRKTPTPGIRVNFADACWPLPLKKIGVGVGFGVAVGAGVFVAVGVLVGAGVLVGCGVLVG